MSNLLTLHDSIIVMQKMYIPYFKIYTQNTTLIIFQIQVVLSFIFEKKNKQEKIFLVVSPCTLVVGPHFGGPTLAASLCDVLTHLR